MCRNIKILFNFDPPATEEEIQSASLQFVRKISGFQKPSIANEKAFDEAVSETSKVIRKMLTHMQTNAGPRDREVEAKRAHERALKRFGPRH